MRGEAAVSDPVVARPYIDGRFRSVGARRPVKSPFDGSTVGEVEDSGTGEVHEAVAAARRAQSGWAARPLLERVELLYRGFDLCKERNELFAETITREVGKTIRESREEMVEYACDHFRRAAEDALRYRGQVLPSTQERTASKRILVTHRPAGVVGLVTPWNFPVDIAAITITYALAIGDTVVWKPSPYAPLSCALFAQLLADAGFPPGVLNMLTGDADVGRALVAHPDVDVVSFTGSTAVGERIAKDAALKNLMLELGGNGPLVVLDDADLDRAVAATVTGCFYLAGQCCTAAERILVHRSVADDFTERLVAATAALRVGDPLEEGTDMGPVCHEGILEKCARHIKEAEERGAKVVRGGRSTGLLHEPTVLTGVTPEMEIAREETFGPVAPVITFDTDLEAVHIGNATRYGLTAAVFTGDLTRGWRFAERLDHGTVLVNETTNYWDQLAPFGGTKQSGVGRELATWMLDALTEVKQIVLELT
jgi:succinate-semialdehyde dehydrogenase/glutarate-semialdehyde dehydrogenase